MIYIGFVENSLQMTVVLYIYVLFKCIIVLFNEFYVHFDYNINVNKLKKKDI